MNPRKSKAKSRILIVDDHPVLRQGVMSLINQENDLVVCAEAEEPHQAMAAARAHKPDLAVVDLSLNGASGIDLIKNLGVQFPGIVVLVLSIHDETFYAERALRAGAKGYVMKQEAPQTIVKAVRQVLSGQIYLSEQMSKRMVQAAFSGKAGQASPLENLTDRELQVLQLMGKGLTTGEIAGSMNLSVKTIESYHKSMKDKLQLESSMKLRQYAIRWLQSEKVPT